MTGESNSSDKGSSEPTRRDLMAIMQQLRLDLKQGQEKSDKRFQQVQENTNRLIQEIRGLRQPLEEVKKDTPLELEVDERNECGQEWDSQSVNDSEVSQTEGRQLEETQKVEKEEGSIVEANDVEIEKNDPKGFQELNVDMDENFRRQGEKNTPIGLEIDGSTKAREQVENTLEVEDKEVDLTVKEQIETNFEVEVEERNKAEKTDQEVEISHENAIPEIVVKRDGAFRRQWESAFPNLTLVCHRYSRLIYDQGGTRRKLETNTKPRT